MLLETIKVQNNTLLNIEYHNNRFNRSRFDLFGIQDQILLEQFIEIPNDLDNAVYKCRVIYSEEIHKIEFESYIPGIITSLKLVECNDIDYKHKYFDRTIINELYKLKGNCDDILIIKNGLVTDTSYANIIFWDGKNWITPSTPLLAGTQRNRLIEEKQIIGKEIKAIDIQYFEKARIINAMIDLKESNDIYNIVK